MQNIWECSNGEKVQKETVTESWFDRLSAKGENYAILIPDKIDAKEKIITRDKRR